MKIQARSTSNTLCLRPAAKLTPCFSDKLLQLVTTNPRQHQSVSKVRIEIVGLLVAFFVLMAHVALGQEDDDEAYCEDGTCVLKESDLLRRLQAAHLEGREKGLSEGRTTGYRDGFEAGIEEGRKRERAAVAHCYQAPLVRFTTEEFMAAARESPVDGGRLSSEIYEYRRPESFLAVQVPDQFGLEQTFDVWKITPGRTAFDRFEWIDYWKFDMEKGQVEWIPHGGTTPDGVTIEEPVVQALSASDWWNSVNMEADVGPAIVDVAGKGSFPPNFSIVSSHRP